MRPNISLEKALIYPTIRLSLESSKVPTHIAGEQSWQVKTNSKTETNITEQDTKFVQNFLERHQNKLYSKLTLKKLFKVGLVSSLLALKKILSDLHVQKQLSKFAKYIAYFRIQTRHVS